MALFKKIRSWWLGLFRKRRFNMLNATDNSEEWHIHLSPASIFAALVAFLLLLFGEIMPKVYSRQDRWASAASLSAAS